MVFVVVFVICLHMLCTHIHMYVHVYVLYELVYIIFIFMRSGTQYIVAISIKIEFFSFLFVTNFVSFWPRKKKIEGNCIFKHITVPIGVAYVIGLHKHGKRFSNFPFS